MAVFFHGHLRAIGYSIFEAAGLPSDQARIVADHLVDANLTGHDSHGIIRMPGYARSITSGGIKPAGNHKVVRESPASLTIDANGGIGIVVANQAMQMAVDRAKEYTLGAVAVHRSSHIGRLGDFPPRAAEQDCIGVLILNGGGRFTAPFGGTARRLPPNPISISVPTLNGPPMMLDVTTSMVAGGKIDIYLARNQPVPEGWLIDEEGNEVTDPQSFRDGDAAMLPMGGPVGHKGYGLGMMIDAIAGGLSWAGCSADKPTRGGSGYLALAIRIDRFIDLDEFKKEIQILIDWVRSSPTLPGVDKVYLPGEIEDQTRRERERDGVFVEEVTWEDILTAASDLGVSVPEGGEVS
jgi:uncharacterized oxidoreductase